MKLLHFVLIEIVHEIVPEILAFDMCPSNCCISSYRILRRKKLYFQLSGLSRNSVHPIMQQDMSMTCTTSLSKFITSCGKSGTYPGFFLSVFFLLLACFAAQLM